MSAVVVDPQKTVRVDGKERKSAGAVIARIVPYIIDIIFVCVDKAGNVVGYLHGIGPVRIHGVQFAAVGGVGEKYPVAVLAEQTSVVEVSCGITVYIVVVEPGFGVEKYIDTKSGSG